MRDRRRTPAVLALLPALLLGVPPVGAQETSVPSLRLLATAERVTLARHGKRVDLSGLGVWATPTEGAFELAATRPDVADPPVVVQRDRRTGEALRRFPEDAADGWRGLRRFVRVTFRTTSGEVVAARAFPFCPNTWDSQRIDDSGPDVSTYPGSCGTGHFPFLRGMVWGIEHGWGTQVFPGWEFEEEGPALLRIREGRYRVTIRITRRYAELMEIPDRDARVVLRVRVRNRSRGPFLERAWEGRLDQDPVTPMHGVPTLTDPDPGTLPDLAALPLWDMHVNRRKGREFLVFAASPWNAGPAPLMVEGFRRPDEDVMDAFQYFYDGDGNVVGKAPVGTLRYHGGRGHNHWHLSQLVAFSILDSEKERVVVSKKRSFCVAPTDAVDLTVPGAEYQPWSLRLSSRCGRRGSMWVRTALAAGWADTYFQWVAGQSFDITDLPNGRYHVRLHVNPRGLLHDANPDNDIEDRRIALRGRSGARRVVVSPWNGIHA